MKDKPQHDQQDQRGQKHEPTLTLDYGFQQEGNGEGENPTFTCHASINFQQDGENLGDPIEIEEMTRAQVIQLRDQLNVVINTWGKEQQKERAA